MLFDTCGWQAVGAHNTLSGLGLLSITSRKKQGPGAA
jgi:hypothetical protein